MISQVIVCARQKNDLVPSSKSFDRRLSLSQSNVCAMASDEGVDGVDSDLDSSFSSLLLGNGVETFRLVTELSFFATVAIMSRTSQCRII